MITGRYTKATLLLEVFAILLALFFLVPFYFVVVNSVKSFSEILVDAAALPTEILFSNYANVWDVLNFPVAFMNSFLITIFSIAGIVLISAMAAWKMVRTPGRLSKILFILFVSAMVIPFQTVMIPPLMKLGGMLGS